MSFGLSAALRALPALAGVLLGSYLFVSPISGAPVLAVCAILVLALPLIAAERVFDEKPLTGLALTEPWTLSAVAVVAVCTAGVLWLTVNLEDVLGSPTGQAKAVSGAIVGAVSTFAATAWLKEIQESNGAFLASGQAKRLIQNFAKAHAVKGDTVIFDACYSEVVSTRSGKFEGWGFRSRWKRGKLLQQFLDNGKVSPER